MKMKSYALVLLAGSMLAAQAFAAPAATPDKTNFSGAWKLNVDKSDFGQMPPPSSETLVITQTPDEVKMARTSVRDQGDMSYTISLKLDGTETPIPPGTFPDDSPFKILSSKGEWDGADLIVTQKTSFQDNPGTLKSRYTLSADGKTLTVTTDVSMPMGDLTIKTIYDKQ